MQLSLNDRWNWISWPSPLMFMGTDLMATSFSVFLSHCSSYPSRKSLLNTVSYLDSSVKERTWLLKDVTRNKEAAQLLKSGGYHQQCFCKLETWILERLSPGSSRWKTFAVVCAAGVFAEPEFLQYTWDPLGLSNVSSSEYLLCFALFP